MRFVSTCLLLLLVYFTFGQNLVSGAIIAYHGKAYERALNDLDKSLQRPEQLDTETRAKAYYYRALSRIRLEQENPASPLLGYDVVESNIQDLQQARLLDGGIRTQAQEELNRIAGQLVASARVEHERALGLPETGRLALLTRAANKAGTSLEFRKTFDVYDLLGKIHVAYGDTFYNMAEVGDPDEILVQYRRHFMLAIDYYELALSLNNTSTATVQTLLTLSKKMKDEERVERYTYLAQQLGGN
jgi:hypothetical protein